MDPEEYLRVIRHVPSGPPLGIRAWLERLRNEHPALRFGYFNPVVRAKRRGARPAAAATA